MRYIGLYILLLLLSSCAVKKKQVESPFISMTAGDVHPEQDAALEQIFIDAIKLDIVDRNPQAAINQLQVHLSLNPDNAAAIYRLSRLYLSVGRDAEALQQIEKAVNIDPRNVWYRLFLVELYEKARLYDKAAKELEILVRQKPEDIKHYIALSRMYLLAKNPKKSIRTLDRIEEKIGLSEAVSVQKKNIYLSMKKVSKAVGEIENLQANYPDNLDYLKMLVDVYLASNQENKVYDVYRKIAEIDPGDGTAQLILADYYFRWNMPEKAYEKAEIAFSNKDLDIQSKITYLMMNYVNKDLVASNKDEVMGLIKILTEIHPDDLRVYAFRADIYSILGEDEKALPDYKKALEGEKSMILLWRKVIISDITNGDYGSAVKYAEEALDYFPGSPELYLYLGMGYNRLREYSKSVEILLSGLNYLTDNKILQYQFYANLGESFNSLKDYEKSDSYFNKALAIDSMDASLLNNYAYYLSLRKEKLDEAERMSKRSLEIQPENAAYLDTYGWILYQMGQYTEAVKYLKKAVEIRPWSPVLLEHYGDVLSKLGHLEDALNYWQRAKEKGADSDELDKKINEVK